ncbi:phosphatase PAP2 family protein [Bifidobacterium asteroides]|uniref:phosphatase PAP2 family protein n=1 Tax=Bifidobacterium asteroides TaxID=1684 RepID=UPI0020C474D4|nr:phosphatase PAP2 family protein [Bifidobacterium asteroides]MCP8614664.1 phosphatase PAP2 family protein [Bifidobacterium asteroides]
MTNKRKQGEAQQTWYRDPNEQTVADDSHVDQDPLTSRPRISALVLCLVTGLACLCLAALVWWAAVWTVPGQTYDDMALANFRGFLDQAPLIKAYLGLFTIPYATVVICVVLGLVALVVVLVRRRWWLLGQVAVYALVVYGAARILKRFLPRPVLIHVQASAANSAPSGHTILALAVVLSLLCVVPRVWRAFVALVGFAFDLSVGCSLVQGGWHRPSDVVMGILIPTGLCLIALAATRGTGMDAPGTRMSSASIQIVSTLMSVAGFLGILYACYVIWQVSPGLEIGARWTAYGVHCSAVIMMASALSLTLGLVLAMRQITASPLTRMGLVGRPPAPPQNN